MSGTGGHGRYTAKALVPAEALIPVPDGLGLADAAALLNDGPTALTLFKAARIKPQDWC